jgi:hypothetical protein
MSKVHNNYRVSEGRVGNEDPAGRTEDYAK